MTDYEEICSLKARYFRCMDEKDWDGYAAVFAPDAEMDTTQDGGGVTRGAQAIADFVRSAVDPVVTVHHGHMPEITITSPTTATGVWAMEDHLWWPEGGPFAHLHGYGHYHETYEKIDGRWLIASLRLTRIRVDIEKGTP